MIQSDTARLFYCVLSATCKSPEVGRGTHVKTLVIELCIERYCELKCRNFGHWALNWKILCELKCHTYYRIRHWSEQSAYCVEYGMYNSVVYIHRYLIRYNCEFKNILCCLDWSNLVLSVLSIRYGTWTMWYNLIQLGYYVVFYLLNQLK